MKLWEKGYHLDKFIEKFTVGSDRILDLKLAKYDLLASIAHANMLHKIDYLTNTETDQIIRVLKGMIQTIEENSFSIDSQVEDVHSQIEKILISKLGETGKKIHCGRSRNDQVATSIRLYYRDELTQIINLTDKISDQFINKSQKFKEYPIPGYTHFQAAMPSSFGLWFASYAESLVDDLALTISAYKVVNQNPLGTAAGYGTTIPVDRELTTSELEFDNLIVNAVYAQVSRGKTDLFLSCALSGISSTISKFAYDVVLFLSENFKFISLPDEITTGSSIMPHKKNPDVFELIRARCNKLTSLPVQIGSVYNNLPSGYHRDFQHAKDILFPALEEIKEILYMVSHIIDYIIPVDSVTSDEKYKYIFSVESVNDLVLQGVPFREAYQRIAKQIEKGEYSESSHLRSSHIGSVHNLCNNLIIKKKKEILKYIGKTPYE